MKPLLSILLFVAIAVSLFAQHNNEQIMETARKNIEEYRKTDYHIQLEGENLKNIEIDVEQVSHDFLFGCIIFDLVTPRETPDDVEEFKRLFKNIFNFAVFPFYWSGYEPVQGTTKQTEIMEVVKWCKENEITTKGHPLVWTHEAGTPNWLNEFSTVESKKLLQKRVKQIVSEFKGNIDIWDVINEVIHTVNWDVAMAENRAGNDNRYTGTDLMMNKVDFIDSCFQWAHSANPDAHLIINEFNVVAGKEARQNFYTIVEKLLQKNSPVKGIGIQVHEPNQGRYYYSPKQILDTYDKYSDFNIPLHVTEFIPVSNCDSIKGIYKTGIWTEEVQAEFAEMVFTLSFGHPDMASINWWGFSDANIWQEGGGLVDENLNPKPVYNTIDRLINKKWKTNHSQLQPRKNGKVTFRGFKGDYKIIIKKNGEILKETTLDFNNYRNTNEPFSIQL